MTEVHTQRAEAARWLAFVNSDLHPAFVPLFNPGAFHPDESQHEAIKDAARKRVRAVLERAERQLQGRQWLAGFRSFADPYLYITLRWAGANGITLGGLDNLTAFKQRMEADPGVQAALKAEGLEPEFAPHARQQTKRPRIARPFRYQVVDTGYPAP